VARILHRAVRPPVDGGRPVVRLRAVVRLQVECLRAVRPLVGGDRRAVRPRAVVRLRGDRLRAGGGRRAVRLQVDGGRPAVRLQVDGGLQGAGGALRPVRPVDTVRRQVVAILGTHQADIQAVPVIQVACRPRFRVGARRSRRAMRSRSRGIA